MDIFNHLYPYSSISIISKAFHSKNQVSPFVTFKSFFDQIPNLPEPNLKTQEDIKVVLDKIGTDNSIQSVEIALGYLLRDFKKFSIQRDDFELDPYHPVTAWYQDIIQEIIESTQESLKSLQDEKFFKFQSFQRDLIMELISNIQNDQIRSKCSTSAEFSSLANLVKNSPVWTWKFLCQILSFYISRWFVLNDVIHGEDPLSSILDAFAFVLSLENTENVKKMVKVRLEGTYSQDWVVNKVYSCFLKELNGMVLLKQLFERFDTKYKRVGQGLTKRFEIVYNKVMNESGSLMESKIQGKVWKLQKGMRMRFAHQNQANFMDKMEVFGIIRAFHDACRGKPWFLSLQKFFAKVLSHSGIFWEENFLTSFWASLGNSVSLVVDDHHKRALSHDFLNMTSLGQKDLCTGFIHEEDVIIPFEFIKFSLRYPLVCLHTVNDPSGIETNTHFLEYLPKMLSEKVDLDEIQQILSLDTVPLSAVWKSLFEVKRNEQREKYAKLDGFMGKWKQKTSQKGTEWVYIDNKWIQDAPENKWKYDVIEKRWILEDPSKEIENYEQFKHVIQENQLTFADQTKVGIFRYLIEVDDLKIVLVGLAIPYDFYQSMVDKKRKLNDW